MGELAHGTMLIGALAGTACAAAGLRSGRAIELAAASVMLAAMADMALTGFVPALAWALLLLIAGMALGVRLRRFRGIGGRDIRSHRITLELHRALAFIVGAWALAGTSAPQTATSAHHHVAGGFALGAAAVAMTAFGAWLVVRLLRPEGRNVLHAAEAASTTIMLAAMALPSLVSSLG